MMTKKPSCNPGKLQDNDGGNGNATFSAISLRSAFERRVSEPIFRREGRPNVAAILFLFEVASV